MPWAHPPPPPHTHTPPLRQMHHIITGCLSSDVMNKKGKKSHQINILLWFVVLNKSKIKGCREDTIITTSKKKKGYKVGSRQWSNLWEIFWKHEIIFLKKRRTICPYLSSLKIKWHAKKGFSQPSKPKETKRTLVNPCQPNRLPD